MLYSFIHKEVQLDFSNLSSFIIVQFKSRAVSSLLPFLKYKAEEIMSNPICKAQDIFGLPIERLATHLKLSPIERKVAALDEFFLSYYCNRREGFISDLVNQFKKPLSLNKILELTNYSYSTLERHFKRDTGLTPKQYQCLRRYKAAVEEIYDTQNTDWIYYVEKFGYFDQSHFIKEIKRYTTFTPAQLLSTPGLRTYRPKKV